MFKRAFNVVGLSVRIAERKVRLLGFAARRSVIAMLGCLIAAIVALAGVSILLGAGYVALQAIVGVPIALAAVGVFLLLAASIIWIIANRRGKNKGESRTEYEVQENAESDEEELRSMLGMSSNKSKPDIKHPVPYTRPSPRSDSNKGIENPKVVLAAGFALVALLGPGRIFRTIRIATALASLAALANRAAREQREKQDSDRGPEPPDTIHTPVQSNPNPAANHSPLSHPPAPSGAGSGVEATPPSTASRGQNKNAHTEHTRTQSHSHI